MDKAEQIFLKYAEDSSKAKKIALGTLGAIGLTAAGVLLKAKLHKPPKKHSLKETLSRYDLRKVVKKYTKSK
jgi:hypothetical protein